VHAKDGGTGRLSLIVLLGAPFYMLQATVAPLVAIPNVTTRLTHSMRSATRIFAATACWT